MVLKDHWTTYCLWFYYKTFGLFTLWFYYKTIGPFIVLPFDHFLLLHHLFIFMVVGPLYFWFYFFKTFGTYPMSTHCFFLTPMTLIKGKGYPSFSIIH